MPASRRTRRARKYQTRPDLICYWQDSLLVLHDVSGGRRLLSRRWLWGCSHSAAFPEPLPTSQRSFPASQSRRRAMR